jgi:hypothetical protein
LLMVHLLLSTQTNSPSLTLPRRKAKNGKGGQAGGEGEGAGDPHPLRNLFRPSLLRNPDLLVGLAWFFQQWSATSTATATATSRSGSKGAERAGGLRELVGEDETVYARLKWAIDLVRETLASGATSGGAEDEDEDVERDRRGRMDWR